jgi:glycosyltransferase involved in cell wall biosynthesis
MCAIDTKMEPILNCNVVDPAVHLLPARFFQSRKQRMKIAQVAPLMESVPPKCYGGTERVVSWITEELVRQGHDVTLFAAGDSVTSANLIPCCPRGLRLEKTLDPMAHHVVMLNEIRRRAAEFDVMHFHIDYLHFPLFCDRPTRTLTTLHGRLDLPDLPAVFGAFPEMPLTSISNHQRQPIPALNWVGTIYHGLPRDLLPYRESPSWDYLAFLGRICPEKRVDRAITIAKRVGMKLKIAAKVDPVDRKYFENVIKPLLDDPLIEFIGEIGDQDKAEFLGNAYAMLFPIDWPEPFGLVMIEAMSCGTPVVAYRRGSVPEVIDHGLTGLVVDDEDEAVTAVRRVSMLDRVRVRHRFEERFSLERMVAGYCALYSDAVARAEPAIPLARA